MGKFYICKFGDCEKEGNLIIITIRRAYNERYHFCSIQHAILFLLKQTIPDILTRKEYRKKQTWRDALERILEGIEDE